MHLYNQSTAAVLGGLVAFIGSCATEPPPRPVALDPSNPAASESPPAVIPSLAAPQTPAVEIASPDPEKTTKQEPTVYTCPMHPEVISDKPGRCPKCGMELVPKEKKK